MDHAIYKSKTKTSFGVTLYCKAGICCLCFSLPYSEQNELACDCKFSNKLNDSMCKQLCICLGFPARSGTNQAVQLQNMAKSENLSLERNCCTCTLTTYILHIYVLTCVDGIQKTILCLILSLCNTFEPVCEKTNNVGFRPGPTHAGLCSYRRGLDALNFGFRKKRNLSICVAKIKVLISFAVTAKLICAFVYAYADCWFSHVVAHLIINCDRF